jgi:NAD+ kinase
MPGKVIIPNKIVIAVHPLMKEALKLTLEIADFLEQHNVSVSHGLLSDDKLRQDVLDCKFDVMIALGGDGTMLRAGHLCGPSETPILGINLGSFGFLMEIQQKSWRELLPNLLEGNYWLEHRMMLCTEQWRADQKLGRWQVVNEAVVSRGKMLRPVHLDTYVDGRYLTTYVADGIIAATPTGSTAYALAAGGPILPPELRNILLVAVAPHLSLDRAIVLAEGSSVSVYVYSDYPAVLSIDGQEPVELADGDRVESCASEHTLQFIRFQDPDYFYRNLTAHMNQNPSIGNYR